jgi:TetR/AcrR family transcriptional regulator, regulator of cefoperazone and chloramphenicol sensitivity
MLPSPMLPPDSDETRDRLIDAAVNVFAEHGYEAATVRMICERAGVRNIGAVNYYFQGKDRLYMEAVQRAVGGCTSRMVVPVRGPEVTAEQQLREFIRGMLTAMLESPKASRILWMRELACPTEACAEAVRKSINPMARLLQDVLSEMTPEMPVEQRWMSGFSIVGQCLYYSQNQTVIEVLVGPEIAAHMTAERLAGHIADFSLTALRHRKEWQ